jgi:sugar lactone lactonase YvrE/enterochelin esterase-like enzyme
MTLLRMLPIFVLPFFLLPGALSQPEVPKGEVLRFTFDRSKIFPGTVRDYWVYVPAQYTPDKPACLYVNQDGVQWQAPAVFDTLIAQKEMPVTIGLFVMHGRVKAQSDSALDRFNRSYEYDGLGDSYARFLLEELLPEVEMKKTADGRPIRISRDGNDHAIGGASSGAICALTVAWERPDQFPRVFSAIGTYVGLRGGDRYPTLIRKYEPKPIRVFLQDGSNDLNIYGGDWWMANQMMERALTFAGYEVQHVWGDGGHNGQQGTAIFPDAMRWLWKDWPEPVKSGRSRNTFLNQILLPGEEWRPAAESTTAPGSLASNARGELFFADASGGKIVRLPPNSGGALPLKNGKGAAAAAFGPDGRLYTALRGGKVVVSDETGKVTTLAGGIRASALVVAASGNLYAAEPDRNGAASSKLWLILPNGRKRLVDTGPFSAGGVTLSPDQTLLYVADRRSHWVHSYQIQPDGSLQHRQQYYWLHVPDTSDVSDAGAMCVDRDGRLYVATNLGIQVCDQAGRVNCILPLPGGAVTGLCFGGENGATLYAAGGGKLYQRKLAVRGAHAWAAPTRPAPPRL